MTDITPAASATTGGSITSLFARVRTALREAAQVRATVRELQALTDRELADLGISRFSIPAIAREAVRG